MSTNISGVNNAAYSDMLKTVNTNRQISNAENENTQGYEIASVNVADVEKTKTGQGWRIAGISLGGAILLGIIGISTLSKGVSASNLYKRLKNRSSKSMNSVTSFLHASSNINTFKDGWTVQIMKKLRMTPVLNFVNKGFKSVVLKTKNKAYYNAGKSNAKLCSYLEEIGFGTKSTEINGMFNKDFGQTVHYSRTDKMWNSLDNLYDEVRPLINLSGKDRVWSRGNKHRLKSYITMDVSAPKRNAVVNPLREHINTNKNEVEKALTAVKGKYGENSAEYTTAKKYADKLNKSLNKAVDTEATTYEKLAELRMGSAMTDIVGILFPTALAAGIILKSNDREQRIKKTFTGGIPVVGGVAASLYATARMYTGPKSILFGLISGLALSVLGSRVYTVQKAYRDQKSEFKLEYERLKQMAKNA